ncbi:hypothetical protein RYX36_003353, partial [Vicia faba]
MSYLHEELTDASSDLNQFDATNAVIADWEDEDWSGVKNGDYRRRTRAFFGFCGDSSECSRMKMKKVEDSVIFLKVCSRWSDVRKMKMKLRERVKKNVQWNFSENDLEISTSSLLEVVRR